MQTSKDFVFEDEFENLDDAEYLEEIASKQLKRMKAMMKETSEKKRLDIRKKRKQKETDKSEAFKIKK